jgi:hypothetical protein
MLKERADLVTPSSHGRGVVELIDRILDGELQELSRCMTRHAIPLGTRDDGSEARIDCYGLNILVAGPSASGKSTLTTGLLERLAEPGYQFVVIDPEGDYSALEGAVVLGEPAQAPTIEGALDLLAGPRPNGVVNLVGIPIEDRPAFFDGLLPRLQELRARTGRPHWIVIDETHHLMPTTWHPTPLTLPHQLEGMVLITVHPASVAEAMLNAVDLVLALGATPEETIRAFCEAVGESPPDVAPTALEPGEVLAWWRRSGESPIQVRGIPPRSERRRHSRKYGEGNLGPDRSFHFRGPEEKLNLRAQNLNMFLQLGDGVDDETWMHHLRRGDYSEWFRDKIKDAELAEAAKQVEQRPGISPQDSRAAIREAVERRYTLPGEPVEYIKAAKEEAAEKADPRD